MEVSSHDQQLRFAQRCSISFAAVCVRIECHLHICIVILSYATDLSARLEGLWAVDVEIAANKMTGNLKFAEVICVRNSLNGLSNSMLFPDTHYIITTCRALLIL